MNDGHARLCGSPRWAQFIAGEVVPAALDGFTDVRVDIQPKDEWLSLSAQRG